MWNSTQTSATASASLISGLQPFFLTKQMFVKKSQKIKPIQKDTLFWCFYILKNGQSSYEQQHTCRGISYVKERQLKIELVEKLRGEVERSKLKLCKLASIEHIEDKLANDQSIDMVTFFSLCFLEDIEVFYFKNKCYYKTLKDELPWLSKNTKSENASSTGDLFETIYDRYGSGYDEVDYDFSTIFVLRQTNGKYWIEETNVLDINWRSCYHISNINKPIKAISAYTSPQLKEIAQQFGIEFKGKKKQEIYDLVKSFLKIDII